MRRLHWAYVLSAVFAATAMGEEPAADVKPAAAWLGHPPRKLILPPDCPPAPCSPDGIIPPAPIPPTPPVPPTTEPSVPPPTTDPLARTPEAGTLSPGTFNPNMYGDPFGAPRTLFLTTQQRAYQTIISDAAGQPIHYTGQAGGSVLLQQRQTFIVLRDIGGSSAPFQTDFTTATPITPVGNVPLVENPAITSRLQALNPGSRVLFQSGTGLNQSPSPGLAGPYLVEQNYLVSNALASSVVLPSSGGVVGRVKLADDNSPIPRDRFILDYDLYGGTILTPGGYDVHRFGVGVEKTFFDGMTSVELLMPFASTLDPVSTVGGFANRATEFGNLNVIFKALVLTSNELDVAAGVGIAFPTGPDAVVRDASGADLLRIKNQSYVVTPYVAAQVIPADGWFAQAWVQISYDTTGSDVLIAPTPTSPVAGAGRVHDAPLLQTDFQIGYWLIRDPYSSGLRGLAPFLELHYNRPLETTDPIVGNAVVLSGATTYNELNLTVGASALFGSNLLVSAGMVFPLRDAPDRFFDYQFGLRANWFFGPCAQTPSCAPGGPPVAGVPPYPVTGPVAGMPPAGAPPAAGGPATDPLARAPETGTLAAGTFNPNFFGDQIGVSTNRQTSPGGPLAQIPILPRYAGLKITDNDGPRPSDRVYYSYNEYLRVNHAVNPAGSPEITLRRQIIGLETTLGSDASIGLRVPFLQMSGSPDLNDSEIGDLTVVGKYAVINDPFTGNVATVGLNLTLPTGGRGGMGELENGQSAPRAVFVQPWVGASWNYDDWFVQGVSALVLPTDPVYPVVAFNSIGVGYWIYRNADDRLLRAVVPVIELHANTPVTNRGDDELIFFKDQLNLTSGIYLQFPRLAIGGSVCVPLVGPKPYDLEAMFSVNYQF